MGKIHLTTILSGLAGLALLSWLLARAGIGDIFTVLSLVGLNICWLAVYRILPIGVDAQGWRQLFTKAKRPAFADLTRARWIAESVNTLFPVAQVGGHVLRARIIGKKYGRDNEAGPTVMVDFTVGLSTQILFTLSGLVLLLLQTGNAADTSGILIGIVVAAIVISGFFFSQKAGLFGFLAHKTGRLLHKKKSTSLIDGAQNLDRKIREIYGRRGKLTTCFFWRFAGWIAKAGENWLFFFFIGASMSWREAIILESLCTAFRSAAFFIPGGLGIQDGSLLIIGSQLGLGPDNIMALALGKRLRELIVGLPGLLVWFITEGRYHKRPLTKNEEA